MSIQRIGVYQTHTKLRNAAVVTFSSDKNEEKKGLMDLADELHRMRETDIHFENAKNLITASTTIGVVATAALIYIKVRGPKIFEKIQRTILLRK